jgi:hypothetical protein
MAVSLDGVSVFVEEQEVDRRVEKDEDGTSALVFSTELRPRDETVVTLSTPAMFSPHDVPQRRSTLVGVPVGDLVIEPWTLRLTRDVGSAGRKGPQASKPIKGVIIDAYGTLLRNEDLRLIPQRSSRTTDCRSRGMMCGELGRPVSRGHSIGAVPHPPSDRGGYPGAHRAESRSRGGHGP